MSVKLSQEEEKRFLKKLQESKASAKKVIKKPQSYQKWSRDFPRNLSKNWK